MQHKTPPKREDYCTFCNMLASDDGFTFDDLKDHLFDRNGKQIKHVPGCPQGIQK